jgi:hypothetical protein
MKSFPQRSPSATRARRGRRFFLFGVAGVAALLFATVALPRLLPVNLFKDRLSLILTQSCRRPIRLGEVRLLSFFPPTARISDIVIEKRAPDDPVSGAIRSATFAISLRNLWNKTPTFARIELEQCALDIRKAARTAGEPRTDGRTADRASPVAGLLAVSAPDAAAEGGLRIETLVIKNSAISFPPGGGGATAFTLSDLACVGEVAARRLRCSSFHAALAKGRYDGAAEATFASDGIDFAFDGKLSDIAFEELFPKAKNFVQGTSEATFQLTGGYVYARSEFDALVGSGALAVRDGVFPKVVLKNPAGALTEGIAGAANSGLGGLTDLLLGGSAPLRPPTERAASEPLRFQSLTCRCQLSSQSLTVSDLECQLDERAVARGDGAFFYREKPARVSFRVLFPAQYLVRTGGTASLVERLASAPGLSGVRVPVIIEGDAAKPSVKVNLGGVARAGLP